MRNHSRLPARRPPAERPG